MPTLKNHCCGRDLLRWGVLLCVASAPVDFLYAKPADQADAAAPVAATQAPSGSYRELAIDEVKWNRSAVSKARSTVQAIMRRRTFAAGEKAVFDDYYLTYVLARWSLVSNRNVLTSFRRPLQSDFRNARSGAVYDHLGKLTLNFLAVLAKPSPTDPDFLTDQFLSALASPGPVDPNLRTQIGSKLKFKAGPAAGDCHPAVRIYAMLMIGRLNAVEPLRGADLPKPLPTALRQVLLPTLKDQNQIDEVKIAALVGILRHAKLRGITGADVTDVSEEMLKQLTPQIPAGRSPAGHAWIRTRAADVLGELKVVGANGAVPRALAGVVAERTSPLSTRCAAAGTLGRLNLQGVGGLNASVTALGQLALDACDAEKKALQLALDAFDAEDVVDKISRDRLKSMSRDRLKSRLLAARAGLTAVGAVNKAAADNVQAPVTAILGHLDDRLLKDDERTAKVAQELAKLRGLPGN